MLPKIFIIVLLIIVSLLGIGFFFRGNPNSACPDQLTLQTPVDLDKVTSILYPGQVRGGDFKPHGGFRFDSSQNDGIEVKAPADATFIEGSQYIEQGEVQYMFDFQTPCGIMYRFDHLLVLTPKFAESIQKLPQPKEHDSRTSRIEKGVKVTQGEVIATAVGLKHNQNVFVDFGVYDRRGKLFQNPRDSAICWFDLLPASDTAKVKSLPPADSLSGSQSTLCSSGQTTQPHNQGESDQKQPNLGGGVSKPFYSKDDLYLTHTWPGANKYFSNEETEILLFNESNSSVEVKSFNLEYLVEGKTYPHKSGTWEKYARKDTPQNIEYLNISPQYYKGEPLILIPTQKGKLHWHINFGPNPLAGKQTVKVSLTLIKDGQTININEQFNRDSGTVFTKENH